MRRCQIDSIIINHKRLPADPAQEASPAPQGKSLFTRLHLIKYNIGVVLVLSGEISKTSLEPFGAPFFSSDSAASAAIAIAPETCTAAQ
jgi:hypothetical protein